jgi:hypothetical protein
VVPLGPIDSDFVVPRHVVVHGFPLAPAGKCRWRALGDRLEDRRHRLPHLAGAREQEGFTEHRLGGMKSLNALRQLIDDLIGERFPGLYVLITGTPQFFDGPQGVKRLAPLAQRLATEFHKDPKFDSSRAPQLRLQPFDMPKLLTVGRQIRALYPAHAAARVTERASDDVLRHLAEGVCGALGGKIGVAPRIFLKRLVDVLDKIDEHPDFVPSIDDEVIVRAAELTAEERGAAGIERSVDDIELELAGGSSGGTAEKEP